MSAKKAKEKFGANQEATTHATRSKVNFEVYLVGIIDFMLRGAKLPSNRMVLLLLFYYTRIVKKDVRESATLVVRETLLFWKKA